MNPVNLIANVALKGVGFGPNLASMSGMLNSVLGKVLGGAKLGGVAQLQKFPGILPFPRPRPWPFPLPMPRLPLRPFGPHCCGTRPDYGSQIGLSTNGHNQVSTGRYNISVEEGKVKIYDTLTKTWVKAYGDPHLRTSDGDRAQFHENLTIDLPDGTKVTVKCTDKNKNGVSYIDAVAVMKGDEAVVVQGMHDGKAGVHMGNVLNNADHVDAMWADGTVLRAGKQVDDLTFASNGREVVGCDPRARWGEHELDGYGGASRRPDGYQAPGSNGTGSASGASGTNGTSGASTGGSIWDRLWAIISKLEKQLSDKVDAAGKIDKDDTGAMKKAFAEIERIQNAISQITTAMTNLQKADHDSKMAIVRNLA